MKGRALFLAPILCLGCAVTAIAAPNPLGLYIGGSVGQSNVRTSIVSYPPYGFSEYTFSESDTAWKAVVGLRPIPLIAAEFAYVDLGDPATVHNFGAVTLHAHVRQRAPSLSALLFAPIPLPVLGLYARAGVARLESSGDGYVSCNPKYMCIDIVPPPLGFDRTNTDFLYGAGVQLKFSALAVRLEYERINDSRGDPDLLSGGVTWTF